MQTVPSLIGTGTVTAAATTGLVFGQPLEPSFSPSRADSRRLYADLSIDNTRETATPPPISRPGTGCAIQYPQSVDENPSPAFDGPHPSPLFSNPVDSSRQSPNVGAAQPATFSKTTSRRQSYIRSSEVSTPANKAETSRDSVSSTHGTWRRRLSLRPTSQHGSPRSSFGPDSAMSFSQASGSVLSPATSITPSNTPNKLTKRMSSTRDSLFSKLGSKGQVGTLPRPSTSHQRSATIFAVPASPTAVNHQSEQISRPRASTAGQANVPWRAPDQSSWSSFFHMRRVRISRRGAAMTSSKASSGMHRAVPGTRLRMQPDTLPRPFLIHPQMLSGEVLEVPVVELEPDESIAVDASPSIGQSDRMSTSESVVSTDDPSTRRKRQSLSTHFGPPSAWMNRAGSLRLSKRYSGDYSSTRRYASDPTSSTTPKVPQADGSRTGIESLFTPPKSIQQDARPNEALSSPSRGRDLPLLARLSSYQIDASRIEPSPPPSAGFQAASPTHMSSTAAPFGPPTASHSRAVSKEGASTLAGSEMSVPGLASGDDDTDYKSDVMFDSFRTTDTNRMIETPLDTMFDEPFHTNAKTKRLSIQEILGSAWDGDTRILEEDEGTSTPMRGLREPRIAHDPRDGEDRATEIAKYQLSMGDRLGRLSLDTTDDDYDWARDDDEILSNPLSPPNSSLNSRRAPSPPMRSALTSISGNSTSDAYTIAAPVDRPRSTLFDWSEPAPERSDDGFLRPKTAHGKQEFDSRGGRLSNRKSIPPLHIRSQSVPGPEMLDAGKGAPKFGTWAVGSTASASEDWDADFEFEEMPIPESIKTTQPTVKAHSGQIRELSLLVSNLKRLCRHGRELGLLNGSAAALWNDAENIIALASPDEEEAEDNSDTDRSFSDFDSLIVDERFLDEGFDGPFLERRSEGSHDDTKPAIPINAVVRERHVARRRSVFSPEDDIFGTNRCLDAPHTRPHTPRTPERVREFHTPEGTVVSSVIAAMEHQRSLPNRTFESPLKPSKAKLFFDTNSLQELVKRASRVFHALSEVVRQEELLSMSPQVTPRHNNRRHGSPAFTRVFSEPDPGSPRHLVKSQKSNSPLPRKSLDSNGLSQRMQMMTVS